MNMRDWDDDAVLLELAAAVRTAGDLSDRVRAAGEAAYTWRGIDEELELAALTYDSLLQSDHGVRAGPAVDGRTVAFSGVFATVHLQREGDQAVGQVVPAGPGTLTVEDGGGRRTDVEIDTVGCFCFTPPDDEPVRLWVRAGSARVVTDWVRL